MRAGLTVFVGAALVVGCSLIVPIDDKPDPSCADCIGGDDGGGRGRDGASFDDHHLFDENTIPNDDSSTPDFDTGSGGDSMNPPDVTEPPPDTGSDSPPPPPTCAGKPDGYNWMPGDATAMCCGGQEVHTTTNTNCGVCGIVCNTSNGESCQLIGTQYYCGGCVASAQCWSKCCSTSHTPNACAASDCAGNCSSTYCPTGTHCVPGGANMSDYCSY